MNELSRRQAWKTYEDWKWRKGHGIPLRCGQIAVELGFMSVQGRDRVLERVENGKCSAEEVLRKRLRSALPYPQLFLGLAAFVLWIIFTWVSDYPDWLAGGVLAILLHCTQALIDADEPYNAIAKLRIGWSEFLRYSLVVGWLITFAYGLYCGFEVETAIHGDSDELAQWWLRFWSSGIAFASYSATLMLTAIWRRGKSRNLESRISLMRSIIQKCDRLAELRDSGSLTDPKFESELKKVLGLLSRVVSMNHYGAVLGKVFWWKKGIQAVTVSYLDYDEGSDCFNIKYLACPDCPDTVRAELEKMKANHHPVSFDHAWFQQMANSAPTLSSFLALKDRKDHVSLVGATHYSRKLQWSGNANRCRSWSAAHMDGLAEHSHPYLRHLSVAACPVPPNMDTGSPRGVILIARNFLNGILAEDLNALVSTSRALGSAISTLPRSTTK